MPRGAGAATAGAGTAGIGTVGVAGAAVAGGMTTGSDLIHHRGRPVAAASGDAVGETTIPAGASPAAHDPHPPPKHGICGRRQAGQPCLFRQNGNSPSSILVLGT